MTVFLPLFASLAFSLLFVPMARWLSFRIGQVAQPRPDRWHSKPTARLGGVGIFLGFAVGLFTSLALTGGWQDVRWGVLVGAGMIFMLGLYDDMRPLSPQAKLVGQILAAALVVSLGYTSHFFSPRIANPILAQLPNILLTFFWLVGITNAINLLDNMDGLAGGIALITGGFLSYFFWQSGDWGQVAIALALVGSTLGFLVYNFPPASIFMGDSGSLFLGFTLALLAIARQPQASNVFAVMGVPTLLFLLPILDTALVTFTRLLRGQSPVQGGRDHTSHRLIAFGLSERQAVFVLYGAALLAGVMAASLESIQYWYSLVLAPLGVISLALLIAYLGGLKVVTPAGSGGAPSARGKAVARIMLELTFRRHLLEAVLDFFLIGIAYYLAILVRYGLLMNEARLDLYLQSLPVALGAAFIAFFWSGVYRGVWQYVDLGDLLRYARAALASVILIAAAVFIINAIKGQTSASAAWTHGWTLPVGLTLPADYSPVIFLLFAVFIFIGLAASRSSFKILDLYYRQRLNIADGRSSVERVIILGAGNAGEMALRWILMNPDLHYHPVGFLDDDPFLNGRQIHGVPVLGRLAELETCLPNYQVDGLIYALSADTPETRDLLAACQRLGCWVRGMRLEFELLE